MSAGDYINDQKRAEIQGSIDRDSRSWLGWFASGVGAIAIGAVLLKKRIAEGDKLLSNMFNFLGLPQGINLADAATNVGKSAARSNTTGLRSVLNATYDVSRNRVALGPIDIIDDLRNSVELIARTEGSIAEHITERTVEYTNRELVGRGVGTGYFTQGLQRVTFGQVMEDQKTWSNIIGSNQIGIIQKARNLGLINDAMILDKRIFFNSGTNEVLDFRLRNAFSKVVSTGPAGNEVFSRVGRFDMFGQGEVASSIFGLPSRKIAVLGPGDGFDGSRVFIDGNVYGHTYNSATRSTTEHLLARNRLLRKTGDPFEAIAASRQGRVELTPPDRTGMLGGVVSWFEKNLGIGPGFANRASFLERWTINPIKRGRAIQSGEGTILVHPFRSEFSTSKVMDAALGGDIPEILRAGGRAIPVSGGGVPVSMEELTGVGRFGIPKRIGVLFDLVDNVSVVKTQSFNDRNRRALVSSDLVVPIKSGGYKIHGKNISERSPVSGMSDIDTRELTAVGYKSVTSRYAYYDVPKGMTGLKDFASYAFYRLNSLASETGLGIGFAPSHKLSVNIARVATIPVIYEALRQGYNYLDYVSERVTGVSPTKLGASIYAGARVVQQAVRTVTGIGPATDFLEKYFPGSINSDGAIIGRSIVAPMLVANRLMKSGNVAAGLLGAIATYVGIGGPDPTQTPGELISEYSGETKVPVRKGAWWGLGYTPLMGGKPDRFEASWYAKLQSDYRTKSLYGSQSEYWSYHANVFGIPFPTPSNLFGVLNIVNPYRLEELNYDSRPYPQTSSNLETFPIVGPILSRTVGQLVKPTTYREPTRLPLREMSLAPRGVTPTTARMLGMAGSDATSYEAEDPATAVNVMSKMANVASEPLGIYKFVMEFFGVKLAPDVGSKYAQSNTMSDVGREFYDSNYGGALGQTEFLRRFLINDYSAAYRRSAEVNPIRNNQPTWLPGEFSENPRDRSYFVDFTMGDPYSKIEDGEARLPGAGYEALNELYSGTSGQYSDVDKFLILADVAPFSASYKKYENIVTNMELDDKWTQRVSQAIENRNQVIGVDARYKRYEDDIINLNLGTLEKALYAPIRKTYDFITHDILAEIPYLGSKLFPFRDPYEQYRKMYVEGSEYASWDRPWEDIVRPALYDMALEDPFTAAGKGAMIGLLASGPMRWFNPIRSSVAPAGAALFNTSTVLGGAAIGAGLSSARILSMNDQDMLPYHIRREDDFIQYTDALTYIKKRMNPDYKEPSMLGARSPEAYRAALPRSVDRRYFDYFSNMQDSDRRSQIVQGLPDYMSEGLEQTWNNDFPDSQESDAAALDIINNQPMPSPEWQGWSPSISSAATRLRLIEHGVNGVSDNIHRFGFYESHAIDLKTRLSSFNEQQISFVQSPNYGSLDQFINAYNPGGQKIKVSRYSTPNSSRREGTIKTQRDNRQDIRSRIAR